VQAQIEPLIQAFIGPEARMQTHHFGQIPDVANAGGRLRGGGPSNQVGRLARQAQLAHAVADPRHSSQVIVPIGHEDSRMFGREKRRDFLHAVEKQAVE
jgi:hypothetical protein